jgi:hypothetical protein
MDIDYTPIEQGMYSSLCQVGKIWVHNPLDKDSPCTIKKIFAS